MIIEPIRFVFSIEPNSSQFLLIHTLYLQFSTTDLPLMAQLCYSCNRKTRKIKCQINKRLSISLYPLSSIPTLSASYWVGHTINTHLTRNSLTGVLRIKNCLQKLLFFFVVLGQCNLLVFINVKYLRLHFLTCSSKILC